VAISHSLIRTLAHAMKLTLHANAVWIRSNSTECIQSLPAHPPLRLNLASALPQLILLLRRVSWHATASEMKLESEVPSSKIQHHVSATLPIPPTAHAVSHQISSTLRFPELSVPPTWLLFTAQDAPFRPQMWLLTVLPLSMLQSMEQLPQRLFLTLQPQE
jgi:hypothetical protein